MPSTSDTAAIEIFTGCVHCGNETPVTDHTWLSILRDVIDVQTRYGVGVAKPGRKGEGETGRAGFVNGSS